MLSNQELKEITASVRKDAFFGGEIQEEITLSTEEKIFLENNKLEAMERAWRKNNPQFNRVFSEEDKQQLHREAAQAERSGKARLVERRKSPTEFEKQKEKALLDFHRHIREVSDTPEKRFKNLGLHYDENMSLDTGEIFPRYRYEPPPPPERAPTDDFKDDYFRARVESRNWDDAWRIVCTSPKRHIDAPAPNHGSRITSKLSSKARGKIIESGLYMQAVKGGFNAFLTPTFDAAARWRLENKHYQKDKGGKAGEIIEAVYSADGEKLLHAELIAAGKFTRVKFELGTIGRELSRFLDALSKMHTRKTKFNGKASLTPKAKPYPWGKVECIGRADKLYPWGKVSSVGGSGDSDYDVFKNNERLYPWGKVACVDESTKPKPVFDYLWVAEAPHTIHGEREYPWGTVQSVGKQNPHAHMLIRWNVEPQFFHEWAAKIERLWGQGFVTIERIKSAAAAPAYLLKALGYLSKGAESERQGDIKGNRYNISKYARAEKWEVAKSFVAQHMYSLLEEYAQGLDAKRKRRNNARLLAKKTLATKTKLKKINAKKGNFTQNRQRFIERLEEKFNQATEKAESLTLELQDNYSAGGTAKFASKKELEKFMEYAIAVRGWRAKAVYRDTEWTLKAALEDGEQLKKAEFIIKSKQLYDDSLERVGRFYSRYEPVFYHDLPPDKLLEQPTFN